MNPENQVFIDSNVFINGLLFKDSNSRLVLELVESGRLKGYASSTVAREVHRFFSEELGRKEGHYAMQYVGSLCIVMDDSEAKNEAKKLEGKIKEKDLPNIAITRLLGLKFLISFDRDYVPFKEYSTPKKFIEKIGLYSFKTDY